MAEYVMQYQGERVCDVFAREGTKDLYASAAKERIVRCRDCKYATDDGYSCKFFSHYEQGAYYQWENVPAEVEPEGFCKWAVRSEEDA